MSENERSLRERMEIAISNHLEVMENDEYDSDDFKHAEREVKSMYGLLLDENKQYDNYCIETRKLDIEEAKLKDNKNNRILEYIKTGSNVVVSAISACAGVKVVKDILKVEMNPDTIISNKNALSQATQWAARLITKK